MLTIQPTKIAFEGQRKRPQYRRLTPEEIQRINEERDYQESYDELEDQRNEFLDLANSKEFKMPKAAKVAIEGGAVVTTALLGGMASGWGTKKTIQGFAKLNKSSAMQKVKKHIIAVNEFIKKSAKMIKENFLESDAYKMPANYIKKQSNKFKSTKIGKPIAEFFASVGRGVKAVFKSIKKGFNYIVKKIKGIDKVKAEKAAVNTVGVSGGIASGVTAVKEKQQSAGDEE